MVNIGNLRHRVALQHCTKNRNPLGDNIDTWTTYSVRWAEVRPKAGRERFASSQVIAESDMVITLRYFAEVKSTDRLLWRGQVLEVVAPPENIGGKDRITRLYCRVYHDR